MTHGGLLIVCRELGLSVEPQPADGRRSYSAAPKGERAPRVYWSTSYEGGLLGKPRVIMRSGHDTHARTYKEISYLVQRQ